MKIRYLFIILLMIFSCKTVKVNTELPLTNTKVEYHKNGILKSVGNVEDFFSEHYSYRIGFWNEFYENGKLMESGNYKLDKYIQCCVGGLCDGYYSYKIGEWVYFYENGKVKAKGIYRIGEKHKKTNCEDGDKIKFGFVTELWKFYNENGEEIKPTKKDIDDIEKSSVLDEWNMIN